MATYHKNSDETIFKINKAYDKAIKDINEDINNIFRNYQIKFYNMHLVYYLCITL